MKALRFALPLLATGFWLALPQLHSQSVYGTLSNFDIYNDTGEDTEGFEIELDGLSSRDIVGTFGGAYSRYGAPTLVNFTGGVYVRYMATYNAKTKKFNTFTPIPANPTPTAGHACFALGSSNYWTSGCEHFGVAFARNPSAVHDRWLVPDKTQAGRIVRFAKDAVMPSPAWTYTPGGGGNPGVVDAEIDPPPPDPGYEFGDAFWVKVFVTESPSLVELDHLMSGDPAVPDKGSEVEVEWEILQADSGAPGGGLRDNAGNLNAGDESVTRRYEFYKYTGAYDPETHEALCADGSCNAPSKGEQGPYMGAQMAEIQIGGALVAPEAHITRTAFVFNAAKKTYSGTLTVANAGAGPIKGPVEILFPGLPAGVNLSHATGTFQGSPYVIPASLKTAATSLAPGKSVSLAVTFTSAPKALSLSPVVYTGKF